MRLFNVVAVATTILGLELAVAGAVEAQQKWARVQVAVTVVSDAITPRATDSLVTQAAIDMAPRLLPAGVRVTVKDQVPMASASKPMIRRVAIEYVAS